MGLPDTALLTVLLVMDLPMELSDMVLAMLLPMPHPWSMLPLWSTMPLLFTMPLLSMLPLLPTTLSAMLPPTLLRSPPTPTTMEWLTSTLALPPTLRLSLLPTTLLPTPLLLSTLLPTPLPTTLLPTLLPTMLLPMLLLLSMLDTALLDTDLLDTALLDMALLDTVLPTLDKQELPQATFKK